MSTFFYTQLEGMRDSKSYSYAKLERILKRKKVNLFDFKYTLIPVNLPHSHWLLIVVDIANRSVTILDSLGPSTSLECETFLNTVLPFLQDHFTTSSLADHTQWTISTVENLPLQGNGFDCGLCTSLNLEVISRIGRLEAVLTTTSRINETYQLLPDGITIS